jgi:hypothetical protein
MDVFLGKGKGEHSEVDAQDGDQGDLRVLETGGQARLDSENGDIYGLRSDLVRLLTVAAPWTYTGKDIRPPGRHDHQPNYS